MSMKTIAETINARSVDYEISRLQYIREDLKHLKRKPTKKIFPPVKDSKDYAFHAGGRTELQFNIGYEKNRSMLRYGLAFSLETSRSFPSIDFLFPKILRLNSLIREKPEMFSDFQMFLNVSDEKIHESYRMHEIPVDWIKTKSFIFFGKLMDIKTIDYSEILETFDEMLGIYLEVENFDDENDTKILEMETNFTFNPKQTKLPSKHKYSIEAQQIDVDNRHSFIQKKLYKTLVKQYGKENVGLEHQINYGKVDVVVKDNDGFIFYEIKTRTSALSSIRQALGQLLEYGFYPGQQNAKKLVVVGEHEIDEKKAKKYLQYLNNTFNLPLEYKCVKP